VHETHLVSTLDRTVVDHLDLADWYVDDLTHRLPDCRVVHVSDDVQIRTTQRPPLTHGVWRRFTQRDASGNLSSLNRFTVDVKEVRLNAHRMTRGVDRHPEHRGLEDDFTVRTDVRSPFSPRGAHARAPRGERQTFIHSGPIAARAPHDGPSHDPDVVRDDTRVFPIFGRHVLEKARHTVESKGPRRIGVTESNDHLARVTTTAVT